MYYEPVSVRLTVGIGQAAEPEHQRGKGISNNSYGFGCSCHFANLSAPGRGGTRLQRRGNTALTTSEWFLGSSSSLPNRNDLKLEAHRVKNAFEAIVSRIAGFRHHPIKAFPANFRCLREFRHGTGLSRGDLSQRLKRPLGGVFLRRIQKPGGSCWIGQLRSEPIGVTLCSRGHCRPSCSCHCDVHRLGPLRASSEPGPTSIFSSCTPASYRLAVSEVAFLDALQATDKSCRRHGCRALLSHPSSPRMASAGLCLENSWPRFHSLDSARGVIFVSHFREALFCGFGRHAFINSPNFGACFDSSATSSASERLESLACSASNPMKASGSR